MVSRNNPTERVIAQFLRIASYLSRFRKKDRLRLIDHTFIVISGVGLLFVTIEAWLQVVKATPFIVFTLAPTSFFGTLLVILISMVVCEVVIRKWIL